MRRFPVGPPEADLNEGLMKEQEGADFLRGTATSDWRSRAKSAKPPHLPLQLLLGFPFGFLASSQRGNAAQTNP